MYVCRYAHIYINTHVFTMYAHIHADRQTDKDKQTDTDRQTVSQHVDFPLQVFLLLVPKRQTDRRTQTDRQTVPQHVDFPLQVLLSALCQNII